MGYYNTGFFAPKASVDAASRQRDFNEGQRKGRADAPQNEKDARYALIQFQPQSRWPETPYGRGYITGAKLEAESHGKIWVPIEAAKREI